MTTTQQCDLPELPDPACEGLRVGRIAVEYTADQMREYGRLCRATAEQGGKVEGPQRKDGQPGIDRLWDSQWVNIVNDPAVLNAETQEDAVNLAVKMTEKKMAENFRLAKPTQPAATQQPVASLWLRKIDVTMIQAAREGGMEMVSVMAKLAPEAGWTEPFTVSTAEGCDACMPYGLHGKETCPQCGRVLAAPVSPSREVEALRAAVEHAHAWFEDQSDAISKGCGSSWDLLQVREQRDVMAAALAPVQEKAP